MESLNWGIIGPGNIAHDFALDLSLVETAQKITAVLGIDKVSTEKFANDFSAAAAYTEMGKFITHPGLDVVYIATPHPVHFEQAMICLQNNIPVLCEKPLTINSQQSADLVRASQEHHCFLMEAMWIRFLPSVEKVLSLWKDDAIGKIISVKASMGYKAPKDENSRYFNPALGGGSLLDLGIYPVFLAHLLLGKPKSIKAIGTLTDKGIDESCAVLLDYHGSAQAILDSTLLAGSDRPAEITGEKGIIRILHPWFEKSPGVELVLDNREQQTFSTHWDGHGLEYETNEVLHCLEHEKIESDLFPHAFSRELSETMDEIRKQINVVYKEYE